MMVQDKRLVTVTEASREFKLSGQTLRNWVKQGIIEGYQQGVIKTVLVDANEIADKLKLQPIKPQEG